MKVLIAYDASKCAEAAIDDLSKAGLPTEGSVQIISVAEAWLPRGGSGSKDTTEPAADADRSPAKYGDAVERAIAEAKMLAKYAGGRVRTALPGWNVSHSSTYGSPASEILNGAENLGADLIVVGSQGHSSLGRFVMGSISQKVLAGAHCSVRVARGKIDVDPTPTRLLVGFDGSKESVATVSAVSSRHWISGSEVRLVAVIESSLPNGIGRFVAPLRASVADYDVTERAWVERSARSALMKLRSVGLESQLHVRAGNPKQVLVDEAATWGADCIFVGAGGSGSFLERTLLGSTSAAVASRAHCSVEVVRESAEEPTGRPSDKYMPFEE